MLKIERVRKAEMEAARLIAEGDDLISQSRAESPQTTEQLQQAAITHAEANGRVQQEHIRLEAETTAQTILQNAEQLVALMQERRQQQMGICMEAAQRYLRHLAEEIQRTTRRLNALQHLLIPRLNEKFVR